MLEAQFLERVRLACTQSGLWDDLETDWAVLDCELMPWSMKAQELLRGQYAAVGASARAGLSAAQALLRQSTARGVTPARPWHRSMNGSAWRSSIVMPTPGIAGP